MDIRQLEYFIAVAERGNFTKAAEDLFISRQALSKAVRNLEHELEAPLFVSRDNRLELTEEGRHLCDDARPIVQQFNKLERRYACTPGTELAGRKLSVAMVHGAALTLPDRTIDAFRTKHPDILLSVDEASSDEVMGMVRKGEADIGLVGSAPCYLEEFDSVLVVKTGVHAFVPEGNPLENRSRLSIGDLDGQPFVTFGKRDHLHRYFIEACDAAGVRPDILLTTSNRDLCVRTAIEQHAFFFGFPTSICDPDPSATAPIPVDLGREDSFGTYAIRRKGTALSPAARAFWDFLSSL